MTMTEPTHPGLLPEGLSDRLPDQAEAASRLLHRIVKTIASHGYDRVAPPLAEYEETLLGWLKGMSARDLLRVVDPASQRMLALRPDITAQVGRIAATRLADAPRPLRLSYGGPVLKLKASQLRPEREALQAGAELIGSDSVAAIIEILTVAIDTLTAAGVTELTIDLTLPDLIAMLAAGPLPVADVSAVARALDAKDAGALDRLGAAAYAPLIDLAGPVAVALPKLMAFSPLAPLNDRLIAISAIAQALGDRVQLTLDPTERHGFAYQNRLGFSIFSRYFTGEIGRGGSYTIVRLDGHEEAAVGFSLFVDPLVDAGLGRVDRQRLFIPLGSDGATWRAQGWTTIAALAASDDPHRLGCSHILRDGAPQPL
jgi:ATP phosphoribosyltransferase regulatory subunit